MKFSSACVMSSCMETLHGTCVDMCQLHTSTMYVCAVRNLSSRITLLEPYRELHATSVATYIQCTQCIATNTRAVTNDTFIWEYGMWWRGGGREEGRRRGREKKDGRRMNKVYKFPGDKSLCTLMINIVLSVDEVYASSLPANFPVRQIRTLGRAQSLVMA